MTPAPATVMAVRPIAKFLLKDLVAAFGNQPWLASGALPISIILRTTAAGTGAATMHLGSTEMTLANTISWGNFQGDAGNTDVPPLESNGGQEQSSPFSNSVNGIHGGTVSAAYSLLAGSKYHLVDSTNLNGLDPGNDIRFASTTDFTLSPLSPGIGMGSRPVDIEGSGPGSILAGGVSVDLHGNKRLQGAEIDLGACEFEYTGAYLDSDTDGLPDSFEALQCFCPRRFLK